MFIVMIYFSKVYCQLFIQLLTIQCYLFVPWKKISVVLIISHAEAAASARSIIFAIASTFSSSNFLETICIPTGAPWYMPESSVAKFSSYSHTLMFVDVRHTRFPIQRVDRVPGNVIMI